MGESFWLSNSTSQFAAVAAYEGFSLAQSMVVLRSTDRLNKSVRSTMHCAYVSSAELRKTSNLLSVVALLLRMADLLPQYKVGG